MRAPRVITRARASRASAPRPPRAHLRVAAADPALISASAPRGNPPPARRPLPRPPPPRVVLPRSRRMGTGRRVGFPADASAMRRAGKPTVTSRDARRPPTLAALADAEARQRHALRPLAYHPPDPRAARVVRELQSQVDAALRDQAERAKAETRVESAMSVIDRRLDALQNAFGALADAIVDELDAVRADHASWRAEKAAWTARMERVEAAAEVRASTVDAWGVGARRKTPPWRRFARTPSTPREARGRRGRRRRRSGRRRRRFATRCSKPNGGRRR